METIRYYNENGEDFYNNTVNVDMDDLHQEFLNLINDKGKILDAGCGSGRDSYYFKQKGYSVVAMDASESLVELSSKLIGQDVLLMKFQDIDFDNEFDGIWACASLLHVSRTEIDDVLERLLNALKPDGVLFASFKYGNKEVERDGRYFNYYDEEAFDTLLQRHTGFKFLFYKVTGDARPERADEMWLSAFLRKK